LLYIFYYFDPNLIQICNTPQAFQMGVLSMIFLRVSVVIGMSVIMTLAMPALRSVACDEHRAGHLPSKPLDKSMIPANAFLHAPTAARAATLSSQRPSADAILLPERKTLPVTR
jgi:hypothetical protein